MSRKSGWLHVDVSDSITRVAAGGFWTIEHADYLQARIDTLAHGHSSDVELDFTEVQRMDTSGAYLANQVLKRYGGRASCRVRSTARVDSILQTMKRYQTTGAPPKSRQNILVKKIEAVGKGTIDALVLTACFVVFVGSITRLIIRTCLHPTRFRFGQTVNQIELSGFNAIPIITLISFLIGVVIAYQGALQLGKLGAEVYTVDLLAVTILREMGILLSAIVIAGRSGSTFAAEIGSMRLNEELDAMHTMGIDPLEILVLPRVLGLVISLPILTLIANIAGMFGGGLMIWLVMDISPSLFVSKLVSSLSPWTFWVGLIKAPVFAAIIAVIGCYEGMQVSGSAESLGKHTTRAVVEAIFLIIVFDALFSIFFGIIGI